MDVTNDHIKLIKYDQPSGKFDVFTFKLSGRLLYLLFQLYGLFQTHYLHQLKLKLFKFNIDNENKSSDEIKVKVPKGINVWDIKKLTLENFKVFITKDNKFAYPQWFGSAKETLQ